MTTNTVIFLVTIVLIEVFSETMSEHHYLNKRALMTANSKYTFRKLECRNDNDCTRVSKTSCGEDPSDHRKRCLCADQTHPINNNCIIKPQGIGEPCELDVHCIRLASCQKNESVPETKICQCRDEYAEEDGTCSSGDNATTSVYFTLIFLALLYNNYHGIGY
ncbi:uncharacterized protein LOC126907003 [Daktulosphaira vitifoliae]|uniref:uncharacterized protein LOC126907003 n=1 Tax=Daktulosphaira vitifoliae TaxID=58002 RepID=UPI0021AAF8CC|nr:uncharacterized protein LOC126907003 [Daktulosphaira vitifoliae]